MCEVSMWIGVDAVSSPVITDGKAHRGTWKTPLYRKLGRSEEEEDIGVEVPVTVGLVQ